MKRQKTYICQLSNGSKMEKWFEPYHAREANNLIGTPLFDLTEEGLPLMAALMLVNDWNVSTAPNNGNRYYLPRA